MNSALPSPTQFASLFNVPNIETVLSVLVTIIFIWWLIFTIVVTYHLLRYARDSWVTVPAIALHFIVSAWIFVFATGGFH